MKKILTSIVLTLLSLSTFAQTPSLEIDPIVEFIRETTQVPFMAKVTNTKGTVAIAVTIGENNLPEKYEILQTLTNECNQEALRVVKLINPKYLIDRLAGKKRIVLEVPFLKTFNVFYGKGYQMEYFDKNLKIHFGNEPMYARRYLVDTLSGKIIGNVEYFLIKDNVPSLIEISKLQIDSSQQYSSDFLRHSCDSTKIYHLTSLSKFNFPKLSQSFYGNGIAVYNDINNELYQYYSNGRILTFSKTIHQDKNRIIKWYANGLMASIIEISPNSNQQNSESADRYTAVWDSLGNKTVKNGEGFCEYCQSVDNDYLFESGLVTSGVKEGIWKGKNSKGEILYEEKYAKGVCINGIAHNNGQTIAYSMPEEQATFEGGMQGFAKHLQRNLRYPSSAQRANASGKVYVQFTVCTDGTLCDFSVIKGIGFGCDEESVRVLELSSGKWKPARQRGKPVRSKFTVPISYVLSR